MTRQDYKYLFTAVGLILVWALLLFFCIYRPLSAAIGRMNEKIERDTYDLNEMADFTALHDNNLPAYQKQLSDSLLLLKQKLPEDFMIDEVVAKLGETAQMSNVTITSLKVQPAKVRENPSVQNIDISFQGNYFSVLSFLRSINLFSRTVVIVQGAMAAENNSIICNLTLQIYADNYN